MRGFGTRFFPISASNATTQTEGALIHGANNKVVPVDADEVGIANSADGFNLWKLTFANLWAWIQSKLATGYTFATLPAPGSLPVGTQVWVTDIGAYRTLWYTDGTAWRLVGGRALVARTLLPQGIAPTSVINTGSSNNITLGTALQTTYDQGIFLYLAAVATTPAITAGFYKIIMSSPTIGTVYATTWSGANGYSVPTIGAAINFTVGATMTGDAAATYRPCLGVTIPGGVFGPNGGLEMSIKEAHNSSAGQKIVLYGNGSTGVNGGLATTTLSLTINNALAVRNTGSAGKQIGYDTYGGAVATSTRTAYNTVNAQTWTIGNQKNTATDFSIIENAEYWLVAP